ncbi:hypothetical protein HK096_003685 [Nowakowskiella sp. JEL0078]|nr:hypothetical protein HK096_003685 [Nowakowskiella sp. JEL0078]
MILTISSGFSRSFTSSSLQNPVRLAVVGSGPAGFYTTANVLKAIPNVFIDMYEKLPVPYGLVRYGVAPDHPEVKNVIHKFETITQNERFNFVGNVQVGRDVSVLELKNNYHGIIFSYGASEDKKLGLPNEDVLQNSLSARSFVGWYNGHPEYKDLIFDLENVNSETAIVVGAGNVALDVARILLMPIEQLEKTDIAEHAIKVLEKSKIRHVIILVRRGPLQAAFTSKELREMFALPDTKLNTDLEALKLILDLSKDQLSNDRAKRRLMDLLITGATQQVNQTTSKSWTLKFLSSPTELLSQGNTFSGIRIQANRLDKESVKVIPTGDFEVIKSGLLLRSIGYSSVSIDGVPFDNSSNTIPNFEGRIIQKGLTISGMFTAGWIKRGATGVIVSTMYDANETAASVVEDILSGSLLHSPDKQLKGLSEILSLLHSRGVIPVSFSNWKKIDDEEIQKGQLIGKIRSKIVSIEKMLEIANQK